MHQSRKNGDWLLRPLTPRTCHAVEPVSLCSFPENNRVSMCVVGPVTYRLQLKEGADKTTQERESRIYVSLQEEAVFGADAK